MTSDLAQEGKKIARHSLVYGLGVILNRVIGFLMIPIYTRLLTPSDYGVLELLSLTTDIIGMAISMGLSAAMYRFYFEHEDERERNTVVSTAFIAFGSIALVCLASLSFTTGFLARTILDSERYASYFLVTFTSLWFGTMSQLGFDYLRMRQRSVLYLVISAAKLLLSLGLNIYLVVFLKLGVLGILYSTLISSMATTVVLVLPILYRIGLRFSFSSCARMIRFGAPLIPSSLGAYLVHVSDRYFLKHYGSLSETGLYSLGYKFGNLPNTFVTSPFIQIWFARRFEVYKKPNAEEIFGTIFTYFCLVIAFVGLGISVVTKEALEIIANPDFWEAYKVVPIIVLSYTVFSFHYHFNMGILINKKTKYLAYINGSNGVLNLGLNFLLIPRYGMYGAAYATLFSFVYKVTLTYIVSSRMFRVHFELVKVLKIFMVAGLLYAASMWVSADSIYVRLALKTLLVCLYPAVLWLLDVPGPAEKQQILAFARSRIANFAGQRARL